MSLTKEEALALAKRGYEDPVWFCKFFLSHWFPGRIPWVHRGVLAILLRRCQFLLNFDEEYGPEDLRKIVRNFVWKEDPDDENSLEHPIFTWDGEQINMTLSKNTVILMPRGTSKTTLVNATNIMDLVYQVYEFFVYLSHAQPHASQQLSNIAREFTGNARLQAVFGELKPQERSDEGRWSESLGMLQTTTNCTVIAKGISGQIRGLNVNGIRPKRLTADDVEDKENISSEEQRAKLADRFFGDALPSLAKLDPLSHAIVMGTLLGRETLLTALIRDPAWTAIIFGALDRDGDPIWPEWMDKEKLEKEKESYAAKGLLSVYYLEYFNTIRGEEDMRFKPEHIIIEPVDLSDVPWRAMVIDPAISPKPGRDFAAIKVAGMRRDGKIQVLDSWMKQGATPREQIDMFFTMHFRWYTDADHFKHGVESIAWQAALVHLLKEEMFRYGKIHGPKAYFEVFPITHSSDTRKDDRILGTLQPRFAAGYVRLQRHMPQLVTQLLDFPNGKKDGPDALAMTVSLLDQFAPVVAGDIEKDQYLPLDEVFEGGWRQF